MLSDHLYNLSPKKFEKTLDKLAKTIQKKHPSCNLIYGRGLSGAMIIPALAAKLKISFAIIRKRGKTHGNPIEYAEFADINENNPCYAIFIDDLIDTGKTYKICKKRLKEFLEGVDINFLGEVLYL